MDNAFNALIDNIYEAAISEDSWSGILNEIADICHVDVAWLVLSIPNMNINSVVAPRSDPDIISQYQNYWWNKDVTIPATITAPVGKITSLKDTGRERFLSSEFYNDFWSTCGHASERLAVNLITGNGAMSSFGIQPSPRKDYLCPETANTLAALVPHLVRSVHIRCNMRRLQLERDLARHVRKPGALIVDAEAHPILFDDAARRILHRNKSIALSRGKIVLRGASETVRLHRLIGSCNGPKATRIRGGRISAICNEDSSNIHIDVLPFSQRAPIYGPEFVKFPSAAAILILSDPGDRRREFLDAVQSRFSLTPAEAAVAFELLGADGRQAVAERLGVSLATVRTHMMRIFDKVGVSTQAALIVRIAEAGIQIDVRA